ncbi:MAG: PSD1 domain-containing protein [Planctomyces sp.]|nr:PSD1 domain-containing protein [Planctomyces sp.]
MSLTVLPLRFFVTLAIALCCISADAASASGQQVDPDHVEKAKRGMALFKSDVRSILTQHCLDCHGGKSTKADFDLSTRESLMDSGFVTKSAEDSHLVQLIQHTADPHMPFKAPKLSDEQIQKVCEWINLGAPYDMPLAGKSDTSELGMQVSDDDRQFWSFRPLISVEPPVPTDEAWCRTPIDRFIRSRQQSQGLSPNPTADRRILIRRAYFDLTGLPPEPGDVDAFVNDPDPNAWPNLIDRLLASPHYGERWARHWMDVARFAESHGYEQDYDRPYAYHYRDFLIRAFNSDLPYNQFVQWQLAGDELAPDQPMAMMATGFLGAAAFPTQLTEAEFETARYDELDDMVMTTGVSFLGLSVGCARCHDHKFDPVPAVDYYRLAANFGSAIRSETEIDLDPAENLNRRQAFLNEIHDRERAIREYKITQLPTNFRQWLKDSPPTNSSDIWEPLHLVSVTSNAGTKFENLPDGSVLSTGAPPLKEVITIAADSYRGDARAIRLEALTHDSLPARGPGRAGNGNFALGNIEVHVVPVEAAESKTASNSTETRIELRNPRATHQQDSGSLSIAASIDNDPVSGWAVDQGGVGTDQAAVFDLTLPEDLKSGARWTIVLTLNHPNAHHTLGRFRISVSSHADLKPEVGRVGVDAKVAHAIDSLRTNVDESSEAWKTAIGWFATQDPALVKLQSELQQRKQAGPGLQLAKVMVTSEGLPHMSHHADDRGFPHFYPETFLLKRGDVHQKQEVVSPGFLQVLMPATANSETWKVAPPENWTRTSFRRASLANWMTDAESGAGSLAARVIVNRLWQHHFGRGIVASPNDFGISGERPDHPELLEWLAADLVANEWHLKRMHRLIMTSQVYMQSGQHDEDRAQKDRENVLFWRRTPKRLEAEAIRDSMLAVSGRLDRTQFGPGTLDPNMTRRSIYFFIKRSQLIPMMMLFDWPEHLVSIGQRPVTTIAPQALMFMNSPQGRDWASAFADRLIKGSPKQSLELQVSLAWQLAFGRLPSNDETVASMDFIRQQTDLYQSAGHADAEHRAVIDLCQTILSMNEFVYVE